MATLSASLFIRYKNLNTHPHLSDEGNVRLGKVKIILHMLLKNLTATFKQLLSLFLEVLMSFSFWQAKLF